MLLNNEVTDFDDETQQVREHIVDRLLVVGAILGFPAIVLSLARYSDFGFLPDMPFNTAAYLIFLTAAIFRRRLSFRVRALIVAGVWMIIGADGILVFGYHGSGPMAIITAAILITALRGTKQGIVVASIGLAYLVLMAAGSASGVVQNVVDIAEYSASARVWAYEVYTFALSTGALIYAIGGMRDYLMVSFGQLSRRTTQLQKTHEDLKLSEDKFSKAFQSSPDSMAITSIDTGEIIDVNQGFYNLLGYSKEEALGKTAIEIDAWVDLNQRAQLKRSLESSGTVRGMEIQMRHRSGKTLTCILSAEIIECEGTKCMLSVTKDITARRTADKELRQKDRDIRKAYADVFSAVTNDKLLILTPEEIEAALGEPTSECHAIPSAESLAESRAFLREAIGQSLPDGKNLGDIILASGEIITNGVKHAGSAEVQVYMLNESLQVRISDNGPGIDFSHLPKATLQTGFSTKKSLGMGFSVVLEICDKVLLSTSDIGTTVVLEINGKNGEETLDDVLSRGLFNGDSGPV